MPDLFESIKWKPNIQPECLNCTPKFSSDDSAGMSSDYVRSRYPRFAGMCSKCGYYGVKYASFEHMLAGDW